MAKAKAGTKPAGINPAKTETSSAAVKKARRSKTAGALTPARADLILREAREARAEADEMGDPSAAWEVLDELLGEIPADEAALRRAVQALRGEAEPLTDPSDEAARSPDQDPGELGSVLPEDRWPDGRSAWSDDEPLPPETVCLRLQRGKPATLPPGAVDLLLDAGHPSEYAAEKFFGPAVLQLLGSPAFPSVRTLRAPWADIPWSVLDAFTSSDAVADLETLFLDLQLPARALALVLASRSLSRLRALTLAARHQTDIPRGSYALARAPAAANASLDSMDGLPALESLRLGRGLGSADLGALLRSPLAQRVRHLRVVESRDLPVLRDVALPSLRSLELVVGVSPVVEAAALGALADNPSLAGLERLDLTDTNLDNAALAELARPTAFPSLRTLDLRSRFRYQRHELRIQYFKQPVRSFEPEVVERLRARLGEGLILDGEPPARSSGV